MIRLGVLALACSLVIAAPASAQQGSMPDAREGSASDPAITGPAGAYSRPSAEALVLEPPAARPRIHRLRLLGEIGAGLATLGVGAGLGALIGLAAAPACGTIFCLQDPALSSAATGAVIGAAAVSVFVPLSLAGAASLHGGRGDVGAAYAGFLVGAAVGAGLAAGGYAIIDGCSGWGCIGATLLGGVLTGLGGIAVLVSPFLGYELAHANAGPAPVSVSPTLSVQPEGATLGATGTF